MHSMDAWSLMMLPPLSYPQSAAHPEGREEGPPPQRPPRSGSSLTLGPWCSVLQPPWAFGGRAALGLMAGSPLAWPMSTQPKQHGLKAQSECQPQSSALELSLHSPCTFSSTKSKPLAHSN